jgi:hypothetical protein
VLQGSSIGFPCLNELEEHHMYATIRRFDGIDQARTDEVVTKVKETLAPKLSKLPGFKGYYLIEAGNGVMSSLGLFETAEQADESTKISARSWRRRSRTPPRSRAARSSRTRTASGSNPPHKPRRGPVTGPSPALLDIDRARHHDQRPELPSRKREPRS